MVLHDEGNDEDDNCDCDGYSTNANDNGIDSGDYTAV